jgi:hypothetical protein
MAASNTVTPNAKYAVSYLEKKGWSKNQAAGIVANLQEESGVNLNTKAVGDRGTALGVAQWRGSRQTDFQNFAKKPLAQANLNEQLDFVNYELTQGKETAAGARIRATKTAGEAAAVTDQFYERSNGLARAKRIAKANALAGAPPGSIVPAGSTQAKPSIEPAADAASRASETASTIELPEVSVTASRIYEPDNVDIRQPLPNVLHNYPSYTYGLSLHLLTAEEYNFVVSGRPFTPNRVLISSAGRYNNTPGVNQFIRSPYFSDDFYFEDFDMTTVIGTNQNSRNTNAIEFSFSIAEPYGMTLINRLLDQANDPELQCYNYLDMIYLIQIDFFASNNAGEIVGIIPGTTKYFPVKIIQMDIKAGVTGANYQIKAVPYNHTAYEMTTISMPANMEITAENVEQFGRSLSASLNGWQQDLSKNQKIGKPDTFSVQFDPSIAKAPLSALENISPRDTAMAALNDTKSIRLANIGKSASDYQAKLKTFAINAGTSIDKVIDQTVRNSDYIQNQIVIPDGTDPQTYLAEKAKQANQPLQWFKIVPTVTLGEFDPVRKVYARNIIYSVQPYTIYNVKSDLAPQGKITNFVKEYNYMYTGKNDDVLDLDITFNTLYYTAQTAYRGALAGIANLPASADENYKNKNPDTYQGSEQRNNSVMPMVVKPQVFNAQSRSAGTSASAKSVAVADLEDSLMTMSSADMLSVKLKIIGDPQFIKQDDCFYSPIRTNIPPSADPRLTENNSLRTDYGEIYVSLTFRTPVDVDESIGLMDFGAKYQTSVFSGLYRVLTVESEFKGGQFTQTLDLIRIPNQVDYDYIQKPRTAAGQRDGEITSKIPTPVIEAGATTTNKITSGSDGSLPQPKGLVAAAGSQIGKAQQDLINVNRIAGSVPISSATLPIANPFGTLPSAGPDNSISINAAANLLGGG